MKKSHQHRVVRTGKPFLQIPSLSMILSKNSFQKLRNNSMWVPSFVHQITIHYFQQKGERFLAIITAGSKNQKVQN